MAKAKKKLNLKKDLDRVKTFEKEAERIIAALATHRDELRALVEKYSDILESLDDGVDEASDVLVNFENAIDRMSEQL